MKRIILFVCLCCLFWFVFLTCGWCAVESYSGYSGSTYYQFPESSSELNGNVCQLSAINTLPLALADVNVIGDFAFCNNSAVPMKGLLSIGFDTAYHFELLAGTCSYQSFRYSGASVGDKVHPQNNRGNVLMASFVFDSSMSTADMASVCSGLATGGYNFLQVGTLEMNAGLVPVASLLIGAIAGIALAIGVSFRW